MQQQQNNEKEIMFYNVLNNRVAKVALAASILLTGVSTTVSSTAPSNGIIGGLMEVNHAEASELNQMDLEIKFYGSLTLGKHERGFSFNKVESATKYDIYAEGTLLGTVIGTTSKLQYFTGTISLKDEINVKIVAKDTSGMVIGYDEQLISTKKQYLQFPQESLKSTSELNLDYYTGYSAQHWYNIPLPTTVIDSVNSYIDENPEMYVYRFTKMVQGTLYGVIVTNYSEMIVISDKPVSMISETYLADDQHYNKTYSFLRFADDAKIKKVDMNDVSDTEYVLGKFSLSTYYLDEWSVPDKELNATSLSTPMASLSTEEETFDDVLVEAVFDERAYRNLYRFNGGDWMNYEGVINVTSNGLIEFKSIDNSGRETSIYSKEIKNKLDKNTIGEKELGELTAGDKVFFSDREWTLLDPTTGLLSSSEITSPLAMNKAFSYLNNDYLNTFTDAEKELILDSEWYRDVYNQGTKSLTGIYKIGFLNHAQASTYLNLLKGDGLTYWLNSTATIYPSSGSKQITWTVNAGTSLTYVSDSNPRGVKPFIYLSTDQKIKDGKVVISEPIDNTELAVEAVQLAETSKSQADVDVARNIVNQLTDGPDKTNLTNRLDVIQKEIDDRQAEDDLLEDAKKAVDELGDSPTQDELDAIKDKIDELSDGPAKDILLDLIKEKQEELDKVNVGKELAEQISAATKAVELSETSKTSKDVATARDLVNKLPEGAIKTELTKRLDAVQKVLDENNALENTRNLVDQLGENPTQEAIDSARDAVEKLSEGKDKTELLAKVELKQDALNTKIAEATKTVNLIGTPPAQSELNEAQDKVNALPKGKVKTELQQVINEKKKQLGEVANNLVKAEEAVSKAENFPTNYNVTIANKLVEALPNSIQKTALEDRLQAIQDMFALEKAEAKVKQAENYERDPYLADAIALVDGLKDSNGKRVLKERIQAILDKLQAEKEAEEAANNADGAYNPNDPTSSIEDAIDTIQDAEAKKYFATWNKAVSNAENYFSKTTVKNATKYLTDMPSAYSSVVSYENVIKELTERTENLKAEEVAVDVFAPVEKAVASYEKYKTSYYLKKAKEAVEVLPASSEKTAFENRLGINESPGNGTTDEERLTSQLANVEKAVANYEKFKTNFYEKKAIEAIKLLVESKEKVDFQSRFDAVTK